MKQLIASLVIVTIALPLHADTKSDIASCATKSRDAERLICFDELAKSMGVDKPTETLEKGSGQWLVKSEQSAVDDSLNVTVALEANEEIPGKLGIRKTSPFLVLRCSENKTVAYITWKRYLGMDSTRVLTRIDKQKARTSSWSLSTDNEATFARKAIPFIKSLFDKDKLLMQVTPYSSNTVMTTFSVSGLKESIKPLRKACNW